MIRGLMREVEDLIASNTRRPRVESGLSDYCIKPGA